MSFRRWVLIVGAACAALRCWAAIVVCGKCGHEAQPEREVCAHCGAPIPRGEPLPPPAPAAVERDGAAAMATQALAVVREDFRLAVEIEARPELALAFYGNALAVLRLVPRDAVPPDAGTRLVDGMAACRAALSVTARPCPACGGTGSRGLKLQSLTGATERDSAGSIVCRTCNGLGVVRGGRTPDELRVALAQGRRDFEVRQQAAGRVAVGRAWVPPALAAQLALPAQVLLRSAAAPPCSACQGIGRQSCGACRGLGRVQCRQPGCDRGWVRHQNLNTLSPRTALRLRSRCPLCQGTGWNNCEICRGSGAVACAACQGSGQPPRCNRCGGEGTVPCTRCRGTGSVGKNVCVPCNGVRQTLCPVCHGEGRVSR